MTLPVIWQYIQGVREEKEAAARVVFESYITLCQLELPVDVGG